jgi:hypothetical protein
MRDAYPVRGFPSGEGATERGFVETAFVNGRSLVRATSAGLAFLEEKRPLATRT